MTKLYPYQIAGVRKIDEFGGRALLSDEMGLGKSGQVISWVANCMSAGPVLIICPANLKRNWAREVAKFSNLRSEILSSQKPANMGMIPVNRSETVFYIINYEIVKFWRDWIIELAPKLVAMDESHRLGNRLTQQTKAARVICHSGPEHVIPITGTPIVNSPAEFWSVLNMVRPDMFPSYYTFVHRYTVAQKKPWGWTFTGAINTDELHKKLTSTLMIRRLKKDVLKQLPPKTHVVVPLEIDNRKEYDEAERDFIKWLEKIDAKKARRASKAQQVTRQGYLKRLAGTGKLRPVINWVDEFLKNCDDKLIVFGIHKDVVRPLYERFKDIAVKIDGSTSSKDRQIAEDQFTRGKSRLFVGNIRAAGVGWNGQVAQTVAFAEMGWTSVEHDQAVDRVHRIGQTKATFAYFLVGENTIDEDICRIVQDKRKIADSIVDGLEYSDFDIYDQVAEAMRLRRFNGKKK